MAHWDIAQGIVNQLVLSEWYTTVDFSLPSSSKYGRSVVSLRRDIFSARSRVLFGPEPLCPRVGQLYLLIVSLTCERHTFMRVAGATLLQSPKDLMCSMNHPVVQTKLLMLRLRKQPQE